MRNQYQAQRSVTLPRLQIFDFIGNSIGDVEENNIDIILFHVKTSIGIS